MRRLLPGMVLMLATVVMGCSGSSSSPAGSGGNKAEMIIGVWEVTSKTGADIKEGAVIFEFKKDGAAVIEGEEVDYVLDGDAITLKKKGDKEGKEMQKATISTLTADKMVLKNPEGEQKIELKKKQ